MRHSLKFFNGGSYTRLYRGLSCRGLKEDTRSVDHRDYRDDILGEISRAEGKRLYRDYFRFFPI